MKTANVNKIDHFAFEWSAVEEIAPIEMESSLLCFRINEPDKFPGLLSNSDIDCMLCVISYSVPYDGGHWRKAQKERDGGGEGDWLHRGT